MPDNTPATVPAHTYWNAGADLANAAPDVQGQLMTMTSGASTRPDRDDEILAALEYYNRIGRLSDDREKAGQRHARHAGAARKAVTGLRSVYGPGLAAALEEHITALIADVDKQSSIAAGLIVRANELARELGRARVAGTKHRRTLDRIRGLVRSGSSADAQAAQAELDVETLVAGVLAENARLKHERARVGIVLDALAYRTPHIEHQADVAMRDELLEHVTEYVDAGKPISGRTWRRWQAAAADHRQTALLQRSSSWEAVWQAAYREHQALSGSEPVDSALFADDRVRLVQRTVAAEAAAAGGHAPITPLTTMGA